MNGIRRILVLCAAVALLASGPAFGGEAGVARKASDLKQAPFRDAGTIAALATGDAVEILEKQGGWYRVKSGKRVGWVRMLSIRRGESTEAVVDADGVLALATGRAGTGHVVSTTGIRGLSDEELKSAHYDAEALAKLESYAVSRDEARKFARDGNLAARPVE
jgi:hypothetical protein